MLDETWDEIHEVLARDCYDLFWDGLTVPWWQHWSKKALLFERQYLCMTFCVRLQLHFSHMSNQVNGKNILFRLLRHQGGLGLPSKGSETGIGFSFDEGLPLL